LSGGEFLYRLSAVDLHVLIKAEDALALLMAQIEITKQVLRKYPYQIAPKLAQKIVAEVARKLYEMLPPDMPGTGPVIENGQQ
jgi:uncharacterized protein YaaW (UPF0174 family)